MYATKNQIIWETNNVATRILNSNAPDTNYANGANFLTNGVAGTAPTAGDTVLLNTSPPNGPIVATNLAVNGETIQLSNNGKFYAAGNTSFGSAVVNGATVTTSLTDLNTGNGGVDIQVAMTAAGSTAAGVFTNNGLFVNPDSIFIGSQSSQTNTPMFINNGTINYTTNLGGNSVTAYSINGFNTNNAAEFSNAGAVNVNSPAGANEGPTATTLVTQVAITGVVSQTANGAFNVTGSAPNQTGTFSNTAPTNSVLEFEQAVTGIGTFNLNDGEVQFDAASSGTVNFLDASSILDIANVTNTANTLTINGFRAGDAIGLGTTQITRAAYDTTTGRIDLFNGTAMVSSLGIFGTGTQNLATATFSIVPASAVAADASGSGLPTVNSTRNQVYIETNAAAPCYCPGTLIRTDRGEVAVEDLAIGDRVITLSGAAERIKWVGRRAFAGRFIEGRRDVLPVCIRTGALGEGLPRRDLWISPLHAMYLDGALVPAAELVNGVSITQESAVDRVEYIHIELDRHQVIWAEGAASESFVDDFSRAMFHNAHEFEGLYPDQAAVAAVYCAPRVGAGEELAAIKRDIDLRAGLTVPGVGETLHGRVDGLDGMVLAGWAQNPDKPEAPVCLDVFVDGKPVARTVANLFRPDLLAAGLGSGCHSFRVRLPKAAKLGLMEVRRTSDGERVGLVDQRRRAAA